MDILHFQGTAHLILRAALQVLPLTETLSAYKLTCAEEAAEAEGLCRGMVQARYPSEHGEQGFATPGSLAAFLDGSKPTVERLNLFLVSAEWLANMRAMGPNGREGPENWFFDQRSASPFDDLAARDGTGLDRIVRYDGNSELLFAHDGRILPTALAVNYISGRMRDGVYDLERALAILRRRDDIAFFDERGRAVAPDKARVQSVPGYNSDVGCRACLNFRWMPSEAEWAVAWARCQSYGGTYPSTRFHQAVFDEDLLGLRRGGAARLPEFHSESPRTEGDDDEY